MASRARWLSAIVVSLVAQTARADDSPIAPIAPDLPDWPPVQSVREDGPPVVYYREPKPIVGVGLRPSVKGLARVAGPEEGATLAFGADAHVVGRIGIGRAERAFGFWPEAGYVFSGSDGHFASVGIGPASQTSTPGLSPIPSALSFGVVPHFLYGIRDGRETTGLRTSALAEVYFDDGNAWGIELAHQMTQHGDGFVHEICLGISLVVMVQRWKD